MCKLEQRRYKIDLVDETGKVEEVSRFDLVNPNQRSFFWSFKLIPFWKGFFAAMVVDPPFRLGRALAIREDVSLEYILLRSRWIIRILSSRGIELCRLLITFSKATLSFCWFLIIEERAETNKTPCRRRRRRREWERKKKRKKRRRKKKEVNKERN